MYLNQNINHIKSGVIIMITFLLYLGACQSNKEKMGESEDINQTPSLPEAREPSPDTVRLEAKDFVFLPPTVNLTAGEEVMFVITNNGDNDHRIFFEFPYGNIELERVIPPGKKDSLTVKIPEEEGTYQFYCPENQHKEQAMQGEIIVRQSQEIL